jgi:uncharacterized protein (UPF0276 family)
MRAALPATAVGIGLRRPHLSALLALSEGGPDFLELAPENWIGVGGRYGRALGILAERYPLVGHGLSLSLGGPDPLDRELLADLREFLRARTVALYSEHLAATSVDGAQLYDLMPLPFSEEAARHAAARIRAVQDALGRRIAIENISYYAQLGGPLGEDEFLAAVLAEADCDLLLDVNNVYVNSVNHGGDPRAFIARLPAERVAYYHLAGHDRHSPQLLVDTHGAPVPEPVWDLFEWTCRRLGPRPTVIERDFRLPPLEELLAEAARARAILALAAGERRSDG